MAYQKQQFKNYAVLTAEQLNHIEDGIVAAENNANSRVKTVNGRNPDRNGNVNLPTSEGTVKTVNGVAPDESGNVEIAIPDSGGNAVPVYYATNEAQIENMVFDPSEIETNGKAINVGDWIVTPSGKVYVVVFVEDYGIEANYDPTLDPGSNSGGNVDQVILKSPDGTEWVIVVSNDGILSAVTKAEELSAVASEFIS